MPTTLVVEPASEPVTIEEAKLHCAIDADDTANDLLLRALIAASRQECENVVKRSLMPQTWELVLDAFEPCIALPMPPIQSVASVSYVDSNGATQTLDPSKYVLDKDSEPGRLVPATGQVWPSTSGVNAVRIRYVAGYASAQKVPEPLKLWMKYRIATAFETRTQAHVESRAVMLELPYVDGLLDRYRVTRLL